MSMRSRVLLEAMQYTMHVNRALGLGKLVTSRLLVDEEDWGYL